MMLKVWLGCLLMATTLFASVPPAMERATRQVIIKWRTLPAHLDAATMLPEYAAQTEDLRMTLPVNDRTEQGLERISTLTAYSREQAEAIVNGLRGDPRVDYAELRPERHTDAYHPSSRRRGRLDGVPNDPYYSQQWALQAVEAEAAWDVTRGDTSVVVAVVDLGVDFSHPDLAAQRWVNWAEVHGVTGQDDDGNGYTDDSLGYDFMDGDGDPTPNPRNSDNAHGTHVSGVIAATRNNGIGISGLAPGCKIMAVRAGSGDAISYGGDGIYYACKTGAKIINCSWGGSESSGFEQDVLNYALAHGCVVVAAAGNFDARFPDDTISYPAAIEGVLSTAASGIGDRAAFFTFHGPWVKVTAPGVFILSTVIGPNGEHTYAYYQGTSMATPYAAATCALVASRFPTLDNHQIMQRVMLTADPIDAINPGLAGGLGFGRVNAWRALNDSVAGVRLDSVKFDETSPDHDQRIRGGETANLQVYISNDLGNIGDVAASIHSSSDSISIIRSQCDFGIVPHGGPFSNSTPLTIQVIGTAARGPTIPIYVDLFANGRLSGRGTATLYLDSTFVVAHNGRMSLTFAENGSLGYFDYVSGNYVGTGWTVSDHTNGLFHGSFYVAGDIAGEIGVSDNFYGNNMDIHQPDSFDWLALPDSVARVVPSSRADYEAHAAFDDRGSPDLTRLFAQVQSAVLGWNSPGASAALVLEYSVTNRGLNAWDPAYAGLFLDIDLASADGNIAHFDAPSGITYVEQIRPTHPLVGIVPLTDTLGVLSVINNRVQLDDSSWHDSTKWNLMAHGITPAPQSAMDLSLLLGVGPLTLEGHGTRTFAFGFLVGQTLSDLQAAADSARARYHGAASPPANPVQPQKVVAQARLFPNPLPQGETLHLLLPGTEAADVRIYNVLGQLVAEWHSLRGGTQAVALDRSRFVNATGLLFYRIESPSNRVDGKLLILR